MSAEKITEKTLPTQTAQNSKPNPRRANKTWRAVAFAATVIIIAGLIAVFLMQNEIHPLSTPIVQEIVNENVTVNASSYAYYNFTVPSAASTIQVNGNFTVAGGNDIKVYIMDESNFKNWQNGQNPSTYYNSGELTAGNFTVTLPSSGTYYLVYDNTFSLNMQKNVDTQASFAYIPE
jgi:hypothetical protein